MFTNVLCRSCEQLNFAVEGSYRYLLAFTGTSWHFGISRQRQVLSPTIVD